MELCIIGCGAMGGALARALSHHTLYLYDKDAKRCEELTQQLRARPFTALKQGPETIYLLAIKPQDLAAFAKETPLKGRWLGSVLAGVDLATLKKSFPDLPLLRMMPNLAVQYGEGVVALIESPELKGFKKEIEELFAPLGLLRWIPEVHVNALTSLIGSGPAFFFVLIEAMAEAGIAMGLQPDNALALAKQMIRGSLRLLDETKKSPSALKWEVTSPGGTTIAGLRRMEELSVRSGLIETFLAACQRAKEMEKEKGDGQSRN